VTRRQNWAVVGDAYPLQGWKLHVSSIQTDAVEILRRILPTLKASAVPFKVIRDEALLGLLNEGALGPTQVGKFATIYPPSNAAARRLAGTLVELTRGCRGPIVATDLRLGDVVYTRYGGFKPVIVRDRLGTRSLHIRDLEGRLQRDEYSIPYVPPRGRANPFSSLLRSSKPPEETSRRNGNRRGRLLGPGFLLLDVLKTDPKGCVYRGLALRDRESVAIWVVKEGRRWCLADHLGRDMRSRLQHQALVHARLRGRVPIPDAGEYFEADGHGYLPLSFLHGRALGQVVQDVMRMRPWGALRPERQRMLLEHLGGAIDAVDLLHRAGYVHRDLSAKNVFVADNGRVFLLDMELSHNLDDDSPPFGLGTPGFMSPQQQARGRPCTADDVYALGTLTLLVLTGLDPRRLLFAASSDRIEQWNALASGTELRLVEMAARCVDRRPARRPSLHEMRAIVAERLASPTKAAGARRVPVRTPSGDRAREIRHGLNGLLRHTLADDSTGLWSSEAFEDHDKGIHEGNGKYELRRSANRGVAGVLYILGRLSRFGYRTNAAKDRAHRAAAWLVRNREAPDGGMPGLHFGEAGVAVALAEAITGGLVERTPAIEAFIRRALTGALDWPDLTHGAAGQGVAALYCGDRLGDPALSALASRCAGYLVRTQRPGGYWVWPRGSTPASRGVLTGFAHGVAGITYFVAEYARRTGDPAAERAWRRGADWLANQAETSGNALVWPISAGGKERWTWWCHGSIGIALLFLRLHEQTGETRFADIASRALRVHPPDFFSPNLSQCHGYSGVGEAYLEAHRVLGGSRWKSRAESVLHVLRNLRGHPQKGASVWAVESPHAITADLMVGCGGIVHLFLRASIPAAPMGPPLLLDPLTT
jgi:serine/threonine protein kinase